MDSKAIIGNTNFSVVDLGEQELWNKYSTDRINSLPGMTIPGKYFLQDVLGLTSMEISINCLPAGAKVPFLHKHQTHEEVYMFLKGEGEFQVDGEIIKVRAGTVIKVTPSGVRSWRNNSNSDLYYLVLQATENSLKSTGSDDGIKVDGKVIW